MPEARLERLDRGDLAVAGGHAADRLHLAGVRVVLELGADDVIGGDDAVERGLDHFLRRRGHDEERELKPVEAAIQEVDERGNAAAQPDAPARLRQVLAADAPERRVVANQVRELPALVDQVARGEAVDLALEIRHAEEVAQDLAGVVEAEGLIEVGRDEEVLGDLSYQCLRSNIATSGPTWTSITCKFYVYWL